MVPPVGEIHFGRGDMRVTSIHHLQSAVFRFSFHSAFGSVEEDCFVPNDDGLARNVQHLLEVFNIAGFLNTQVACICP